MSMQQTTPAVEPDDDVIIGRRVHQLMWDRRMTGVTLAKQLGMNQSALSKKLRGERGWTPANLRITAAALNTTIAYLVGEVGDPDWCTPWDLNPEPTVSSIDRLAEVIELDTFVPRSWLLEAVPA